MVLCCTCRLLSEVITVLYGKLWLTWYLCVFLRLQPLWKGVLSAEEREDGKAALSELSRRSQFMKNPRYKTSAFSNTAASAAARVGGPAEMSRWGNSAVHTVLICSVAL